MGGKQILFDRKNNKLGLVVSSSNSGRSSSVSVLWGPDTKPALEKPGAEKLLMQFPSLRVLKFAAKDQLLIEWVQSPGRVVALAISEFPDGCSTAELVKKLNEEPCPLDVTTKTLKKQLELLHSAGEIAFVSEGSPRVRAALPPRPVLPNNSEWIMSSTGASGEEGAKVAAAVKKPPRGRKLAAELPNKREIGNVDYFLLEIAGKQAEEPADYLRWLRSSLKAADDVVSEVQNGADLTCNKAVGKHFLVLAALPTSLFKSTELHIQKRAFAKAAVELLSQTGLQDLASMPWLLDQLRSVKAIDLSGTSPAQQLAATKIIIEHLGPASVPGKQLIEHMLESAGFRRSLLEVSKKGTDELLPLAEDLVSLSDFDTSLELSLRFIKDLKLDVGFAPVLSTAQPSQIAALLEIVRAQVPPLLSQARAAAALRISELLPKLSNLEQVLIVLRLAESYAVDVEESAYALAFRKSLSSSQNLRGLGNAISGSAALEALEVELSKLQKQISSLQKEHAVLREASALDQQEIERLHALTLRGRVEDQSSLANEDKSSKLPIIKAMARSLSAAYEFLHDQPHVLSRFGLIAEQVGLTPIGEHGETVTFDQVSFEDPNGQLSAGAEAKVHTIGYHWTHGDEKLVVLKARVQS